MIQVCGLYYFAPQCSLVGLWKFRHLGGILFPHAAIVFICLFIILFWAETGECLQRNDFVSSIEISLVALQ